MALFWVFFSFTILLIALFFYRFVKFKKNRDITKINNRVILEYFGYITGFALFCLLMGIGIVNGHNYPIDNKHKLFLVFGSLIFGLSFMSLLISFVTYFYKKEIYEPHRLKIKALMFICIPLAVIFLVMALDAYAPYASFPLISGISFTSKGIVLQTKGATDGFTINWYGIIILAGAITAYVICDRHFYLEYKRHGLIDTLFILVFIIGIIGARFWSVAVLHDGGATIKDFFHFQGGGLAIMGGVLFGATAGILYLVFFRRYIPLRHAMDMILPCVLIAQAIGRWGNFFNQEVYGAVQIAYDSCWWLPEFIKNQMQVNVGFVQLPLFLIEFITNLTGYFVIMYAIRKGFKNHLSQGDLFCLYIVWYGLTRVILEPLRSTSSKFDTSLIAAWIMFGGGLGGILAFHLFDYFYYGKKTFLVEDSKLIASRKNPYISK